MSTPIIIVLICVAVLLGIIVGLMFARLKRDREDVVGQLQIIKESENDRPYIYLQVTKPDILLNTGKKYVFLKVRRMKYTDERNAMKIKDSQK